MSDSLPVLNRRFMVPALRRDLGAWLSTPVGGYILLLRVRGRRTGLWREVPLSYLIRDGCVWVLAGFGARTEWYRNLVANPEVEVRLPGRAVSCRATVAGDTDRIRIAPSLVRATGLPGLLIGCNPWAASDARLLGLLDGVPLIRLASPDGPIVAGPDDPGGRAWIWRQAVALAATAISVATARRATRALIRCRRSRS